jgi:deoxyribodipyrimidine photolyase-related protein
MTAEGPGTTRCLILVLGDQLDAGSSAFDGFDPGADRVWMAEVPEESEHVWSQKARIAIFLSAMRHFRDGLREKGMDVRYRALDDADNRGSFAEELSAAVSELKPETLVMVRPGEWRVERRITRAARDVGVPLEVRPDRHFMASLEQFDRHVEGRKRTFMEYFYRELRRETGLLMDGEEPVGGRWNFDAENRGAFGRDGPGEVPPPAAFKPDRTTRQVLQLVEERFPDHPGSLADFDWALTPEDARKALRDFITHRLAAFGQYQDAMWTGRPYLYHSRLSSAMNLKLLDPRDVVRAAEDALEREEAPVNSVEGFVRQVLGWREYVRGVYWHHMPDYARLNELGATLPLPEFYWTGETDMNCLRECICQTLAHGYAHHIQRLMVTGLFALLLGVEPQAVHRWYLAVYVDAVEWVELPNTLGMSQFADGGIMATKPYCATGRYVERMSNYCRDCRYEPGRRAGEEACPFTTLYWDFLQRHRRRLAGNPRMTLQLRNLSGLKADERRAILAEAAALRDSICGS